MMKRLFTLMSCALLQIACGTTSDDEALDDPADETDGAGSETDLPPLDPAALEQAIAGLPSETMTGALVRVTGTAGRWSGTSGVADIQTGRPVPKEGHFRIGSVSKVFTAAIVLQLAAEGRVDLEEPVQRYLPDLLPASYPAITVRQILDHTSGLPEPSVPSGDARWFVEHRFDRWTPEEIVELAVAKPMVFAPGTEQRYGGTAYFIAGILVEQVTGRSFAAELERRIARPLGLRHTSLPAADFMEIPDPHANGYLAVANDGDGSEPSLADVTEQSPWPWAEGGMISSAADLDRFVQALLGDRLLPDAQRGDLLAVPDVPYTGDDGNCQLGIAPGRACYSAGLTRILATENVAVWFKTGSRPGYATGFFAMPDLSRILVYSLNPTGDRDGTEVPTILQIAAATFGPLP
jgi:D-alanyl-D-alanine carboxypeptidase